MQTNLRHFLVAECSAAVRLYFEPLSKIWSSKDRKRERLASFPAWLLRNFAKTVFSHGTYTNVFEPILRDLYDEFCEALVEGRPWKARWVLLHGYWSFWSAVFAQTPISAFKLGHRIWD